MKALLLLLGQRALDQLEDIGGVAMLTLTALRRLFVRRMSLRKLIAEIVSIGWESMGVVGLLGLFTGMVLVVQTGLTLKRFGAELYVSEMVALAMFRELGPVLAGFLVAGRVGSGIAAEIGAMNISEQLDAMRSLGADPVHELVIPKTTAAFLSMPLLTAMADLIGVLGGMAMATLMLNIPPFQFYNRIRFTLNVSDFTSGVFKTAVFGAIIALVASYYGMQTEGGTVGVGRSATRSVVLSCVLILVADLLITSAMFALGGVVAV